MPIFVSDVIPPGTIAVIQDGKITGMITNVTVQPQDPLKETP